MSRIERAPQVGEDFDRIVDHLLRHDVQDARSRIESIVQAIDVLASNPLIGRPVRAGLGELVIGRGVHGDVALYRYVGEVDTVFVLALRSQKEVGYPRGKS
jgi:plasmid stabilization system protein ParE